MSDDYILVTLPDCEGSSSHEQPPAGNTPYSWLRRQTPVSACQGKVSRRETSVIQYPTIIGTQIHQRLGGGERSKKQAKLLSYCVLQPVTHVSRIPWPNRIQPRVRPKASCPGFNMRPLFLDVKVGDDSGYPQSEFLTEASYNVG